MIGLYIALNRTPNIDCFSAGAVPKISFLYAVTCKSSPEAEPVRGGLRADGAFGLAF